MDNGIQGFEVLFFVATVAAAVPAVTAALKKKIDYLAVSLASFFGAFLLAAW